MGRKNRRPKGAGHVDGEFHTRLSKRMSADGELKPLAYIPVKRKCKPSRHRHKTR